MACIIKQKEFYMDLFHQSIFYDVQDLDLDKKKQILNYVKTLPSFSFSVEILKKFIREKDTFTWEDMLNILDDTSHYTIIHRKGYDSWKNNTIFPNSWCGEISFCTINTTEPTRFLFTTISEEDFKNVINKFNLSKKIIP